MNSKRFLVAAVAGLGLTQAARADDVNVTTAIDSLKIGAEFKGQVEYNDKGLEKYKGVDPDPSTTVDVATAKLKLSGKLNKSTDFKFRFNLLDTSKSAYDYGYATHWFSDVFGASIGRQKVAQAGWDNELNGVDDHVQGAYAKALPIAKYSDMIALKAKVAGELTLQVFNDVKTGTGGTGEWNTVAHPTWALGWFGDLGPVDPVIQYGSYDNNKSFWVDAGVRTEIAGVDARLDYFFNNLTHKGLDAAGKSEEWADKISSVTLYAAYTVKDAVKPWLYVSSYDNAQYEDSKIGKKNAKANSTSITGGTYAAKTDDNDLTWGVGTDVLAMGDHWTPFVAVVGQSGKYKEPDPALLAKEETRSGLRVKLGAYAEF